MKKYSILIVWFVFFTLKQTIKEQIGQPERGHQRDLKLTVFAFDNDSTLNTDEGKEKLRKAGLSDELDVGLWIAEKLQDYEQNDKEQNVVSQNVVKFIDGKEKSTLNSNRVSMCIFESQLFDAKI